MTYTKEELERMKRNLEISDEDFVHYISQIDTHFIESCQCMTVIFLDKNTIEEVIKIEGQILDYARETGQYESKTIDELRDKRAKLYKLPKTLKFSASGGNEYKKGDILEAPPEDTIMYKEYMELVGYS